MTEPDFRLLFRSAPSLMLALLPDLTIADASDAYLRATMTRREDIRGRNVFEVFPDLHPESPTGSSRVRASFLRVLETGQPDSLPVLLYPIRRPDGEWEDRHWSPLNTPAIDADGRVAFVLHRVEDVTEFVQERDLGERRAEQYRIELLGRARELDATRQRLESANRELVAFSYSVSHDLRAPLRAIIGFGQTLEAECAGGLGESCRNYLARVRAAALRAERLVEDLLRLSRSERSELRHERVDLTAMAQGVAEELLATVGPAELTIAPGMVVWADSGLMRVAIENILGNAWKFTSAPERSIEIGARGGAFFVRDNGAGFAPEDAGRIFEAFTRLRPDVAGTGIGLATVKRIVERHGGRVWAEGEPGKGATIWFAMGGDSA